MSDLQTAVVLAVAAMNKEKARGNSHYVIHGLSPVVMSYDEAIKILTEEFNNEPATRFNYT